MPLSQVDFDYIRGLIQKHTAIVMDSDKVYLAETRLSTLVDRERFDSMDALMAQLRAGPANGLHQKVIEAMTNNETSFFRDVHPFKALQQQVFTELIQRRAAERSLHVWCGACSSGQEPYSIAMLLREHFPALGGWTVRIVGSDLSTAMLQRARQGCYTQLEVNRGLPARLLVKYFRKDGMDWHLQEEIRHMVQFCTINLIDPWPVLPPMDVILLRNVLIYFDVASKKHILGKVRRLLRPDGCLFLGGAETTFNLDDAFERVQYDRSGYYRLRSR